MSILFVLLTFLLFITISYLRGEQRQAAMAEKGLVPQPRRVPEFARGAGFDVPKGYCFHPGHTWATSEGQRTARVGIDSFAVTLLGKVDRIEVSGLHRWVRQGQKLCSITRGDLTVDMICPVEGEITAVNQRLIQNPEELMKDPYGQGWIAVVGSPELSTNLRNLLQGPLVRPWMQTTLDRLKALTAQTVGAYAQDGGMPITGLLAHVQPGLRRQLVAEFFLT